MLRSVVIDNLAGGYEDVCVRVITTSGCKTCIDVCLYAELNRKWFMKYTTVESCHRLLYNIYR